MPLDAGRLRHRVRIEQPVETQDSVSGSIEIEWQEVVTVWAGIEPVSAKEFVAAQSETSKINTRIFIRYRPDVSANMRIYHLSKDKYYNIEGVLADKESGVEYVTLVCSEGVRYYGEDLS